MSSSDNEFYINLLSNGSMQFYPDNKTTSFTTELPKTINLPGDWVVGLAEFQFPCSILTVNEFENKVKITTLKHTPTPLKHTSTHLIDMVPLDPAKTHERRFQPNETLDFYEEVVISIPPGIYPQKNLLLLALNENSELKKRKIEFGASQYDEIEMKCDDMDILSVKLSPKTSTTARIQSQ